MQTAAFVLLPESTSPARGTTEEYDKAFDKAMISIHVPRTGDDKSRGVAFTDNLIISIHIPRTGDDVVSGMRTTSLLRFQSTSPARGTTVQLPTVPRFGCYFNPRPPHGGRHALCANKQAEQIISIHVPRMGGRHRVARSAPCSRYFNPRPPHGGRRVAVGAVVAKVAKFQSASPAWGDDFCQLRLHVCLFSIKRKLAG